MNKKFCELKQRINTVFVNDFDFTSRNSKKDVSTLFESATSNRDLDSKLLQVAAQKEHTFTLFIANKAASEISRGTIVLGAYRHAFYVANSNFDASQAEELKAELEKFLVSNSKVSKRKSFETF